MSGLFGFYNDAGLTDPVVAPLVFRMAVDGSNDAADQVVYYGAPEQSPRIVARAKSYPGIDHLEVTINDLNPGSGHEATSITLSDTADFSGKVAGDPMDIGTDILDGPGGAVEIHIRYRDGTGVQGNSLDVYPQVLGVAEYDQ